MSLVFVLCGVKTKYQKEYNLEVLTAKVEKWEKRADQLKAKYNVVNPRKILDVQEATEKTTKLMDKDSRARFELELNQTIIVANLGILDAVVQLGLSELFDDKMKWEIYLKKVHGVGANRDWFSSGSFAAYISAHSLLFPTRKLFTSTLNISFSVQRQVDINT